MKYGSIFLVGGFGILLAGFLLKTISFTNVLGRVPPYMGPPVDTEALRMDRLWHLPYALDTFSLALFGSAIVLILIGIALAMRYKKRQLPTETSVAKNHTRYPYQ